MSDSNVTDDLTADDSGEFPDAGCSTADAARTPSRRQNGIIGSSTRTIDTTNPITLHFGADSQTNQKRAVAAGARIESNIPSIFAHALIVGNRGSPIVPRNSEVSERSPRDLHSTGCSLMNHGLRCLENRCMKFVVTFTVLIFAAPSVVVAEPP